MQRSCFLYDGLNRIRDFSYGPCANRYTIDIWGNLNKMLELPDSGKPECDHLDQLANDKNQFIGFSYDAAGNLSAYGSDQYSYDAENRLTSVAGVTYTYDGDGKRVKKSIGKLYWYGMSSDPLLETDLAGNTATEFVFINGKRIARRDPAGTISYFFSDHLGSSRVVTNSTVLGKCSGGDAQKCFQTVLKGLRKEDRAHVKLVLGDGKNGFKKGQYGITVDADYRSSSKNFQTLQQLANDKSGVAVLSVVGPKENFASDVGVQQGPRVVLQSFKSIFGVDNYVSRADAVPGQTLFPLVGGPLADTIYSTSKNTEVYVANDQPDVEIAKTIYHELVHVFLGDFGRAIPKSAETAPGVKPQLNRAEQEAERNYRRP